jgi:DNA-binding XRE family transcriptional regulator
MLRIVKNEPPKVRERRRKVRVFDADQARALRAALMALHATHGTWAALADAMGVNLHTVQAIATGRNPMSAEIAIRASRLARKPLEALLVPAPRAA